MILRRVWQRLPRGAIEQEVIGQAFVGHLERVGEQEDSVVYYDNKEMREMGR